MRSDSGSIKMHGEQFAPVRSEEVGGAGQAGVKTVQGAQNFQGLFRNGQSRSHQRGLIGAELALVAAGGGVPGGGHHALVAIHR